MVAWLRLAMTLPNMWLKWLKEVGRDTELGIAALGQLPKSVRLSWAGSSASVLSKLLQ